MNLSPNTFTILLCAVLLHLVIANVARGASYLVDFGTSALTTTQPGVTWNNYTDLTGSSSLGLLSTEGASQGFQLSWNGSFSANGEVYEPVNPPYPISASKDFFYTGSQRTMTLSGLDSSQSYDVTFYGFIYRADSRLTRVTVGGISQTYEAGMSASTYPNGDSTTFYGLTPDASGNLFFNFASAASNNVILNVMELHEVPEPKVALLFASGVFACFAKRRRSHL